MWGNRFERRHGLSLRSAGRLIAGLLVIVGALSVHAADEVASDEWRFEVEPHLWTPGISGTSGTGSAIKIPFSTVLKDLNSTLMGAVSASKNKFTIFSDFVNIKLSSSGGSAYPVPIKPAEFFVSPLRPGQARSLAGSVTVNEQSKVVMKAWIVTTAAGYKLIDNDQASLTAFAGTRFLTLDITTTLDLSTRNLGEAVRVSGTENYWDGIVGAGGEVQLDTRNELYFGYYGDIGTGDSDVTWSVQGKVGYRLNERWDIHAGYRYMKWNLASGEAFSDLVVRGPIFGARYRF